MARIMLLYFGLILKICGGQFCLIDQELSKKGKITDVASRFYIATKNISGKNEFQLMLEITWSVSEDVKFDGILYLLSDGSPSSGNQPFDNLFDSFEIQPPCHDVKDEIWTVNSNGTSVKCQVPCTGILPRACQIAGICPKLKDGFQSLRKDTRNITVPVRFGRKYRSKFLLYRGWRHGGEQGPFSFDVVFCRHELIKRNISKQIADTYCRDKQSFAGQYFSTGPIADWRIVNTRVNMSANRGEVTLEWQDPHNIHENASVIDYAISVGNGIKENANDEKLVAGSHRIVIKNIKLGRMTELGITPKINKSECESCYQYGYQSEISFNIPDINGCGGNHHNTSYCDPVALCKDIPSGEEPAAICSCPLGYFGNGIHTRYAEGEGCQPWDSCSNTSSVNSVCVSDAECLDLDPPSMEFRCFCPKEFKGDGYILGSGCTYNSSPPNIMIGILSPSIVIVIAWLSIV